MENQSRTATPDIAPSSFLTPSPLPSNNGTPSVVRVSRTPEVQLTLDNELGDDVERSSEVESGQPTGEYSTSFYILSRC